LSPSPILLRLNGRVEHLVVDGAVPLLTVLRNDLGLNGPKYGCGLGECGACMVLIDGRAARSCALPLAGVAGREVTTLEGLGSAAAPHPVQQAFVAAQAAQCGYCLNGMIIATVSLLRHNPQPSDAQVRAALSHNLCRCGSHLEILAAVKLAAERLTAAGLKAEALTAEELSAEALSAEALTAAELSAEQRSAPKPAAP
jgi:nicotinate dehydrogenase subunit A